MRGNFPNKLEFMLGGSGDFPVSESVSVSVNPYSMYGLKNGKALDTKEAHINADLLCADLNERNIPYLSFEVTVHDLDPDTVKINFINNPNPLQQHESMEALYNAMVSIISERGEDLLASSEWSQKISESKNVGKKQK